MHGIEINKVAAAIFLSGIIAIVSGIVAEGLFDISKGDEAENKRGYSIEGAASATSSVSAPAAEEKPVEIGPLMAKADPAKGQALLKQCTACHTFDKGGKNGVGPNQYGLVGSTFAHKEDFSYSDALKSQHGKRKWDFQELSNFLANPKKEVPGTKMAFAGIKKPEDRANLIAYLNTLSDSPLPLPK